MSLDSPAQCIEELATVNRDVALFGSDWASEAGELKTKLTYHERLLRSALRGITEQTLLKDEKLAAAHAAVEQTEPDLAERIEVLEGNVERYKVRFKALERRSSNAQSVLSALRDEQRMGDNVHPFPRGAA